MSKIQIWKRITTCFLQLEIRSLLYLICQRYKFESESQPDKFKNIYRHAVFNMSKIQIWKRITTMQKINTEWDRLYLICQRYKFESESQLFLRSSGLQTAVFNMSKIQIWKRITTYALACVVERLLYLICQRYKFESESQPVSLAGWRAIGCI